MHNILIINNFGISIDGVRLKEFPEFTQNYLNLRCERKLQKINGAKNAIKMLHVTK